MLGLSIGIPLAIMVIAIVVLALVGPCRPGSSGPGSGPLPARLLPRRFMPCGLTAGARILVVGEVDPLDVSTRERVEAMIFIGLGLSTASVATASPITMSSCEPGAACILLMFTRLDGSAVPPNSRHGGLPALGEGGRRARDSRARPLSHARDAWRFKRAFTRRSYRSGSDTPRSRRPWTRIRG